MSESDEDIADKNVKIVVLGDPNVGKTSIVRRFCYDEYTRYYVQTMGADFYIKRIDLLEKKDISVRISDIGGLQLNEKMLKNYLFNSNIIILVYDITCGQSFDGMMLWLEEVRKFSENVKHVAIFGNKIDLEHKRTIRSEKVREFVSDSKLSNFSVSAKTGENVNSSVTSLIAKHFGLQLTRMEKERQTPVVKVDLPWIEETASSANSNKNNNNNRSRSSSVTCCVQ